VLDVGYEREVKPRMHGKTTLTRYTDQKVAGTFSEVAGTFSEVAGTFSEVAGTFSEVAGTFRGWQAPFPSPRTRYKREFAAQPHKNTRYKREFPSQPHKNTRCKREFPSQSRSCSACEHEDGRESGVGNGGVTEKRGAVAAAKSADDFGCAAV
jgi:hypothetical protein